ncbi:MAG: sugar ABC transporter ATP-binding protein [Treponema sp.]|nr:sugar ABC transporter ATP-binding protein [Treponema sp.]
MTEPVLSLRDIVKIYPGVKALDRVSVDFAPGEVHALLGENGAGKSTLIKVISGAIEPDAGSIAVGGGVYKKMTPLLAKEHGIEVIYQEFNLVDSLTAAENIFLGEKFGPLVDQKLMVKKSREIFELFKLDLDPRTKVRYLSPAKTQIVEIAKAISRDVKILIMDEPSAPLSENDVDIMFDIVRRLKERGVTIIYISHRMDEIFRISDRVTVLRDGQYIRTLNTAETKRPELISLMVGRELKETYPGGAGEAGEVVLDVRNLSGNGTRDISFSLRRGEILGVAGLIGAGRTEMISVLFGFAKREGGEVSINGRKVKINSPSDAIELGMGLIPEDRKKLGCLLTKDVKFNVAVSLFRKLSNFFVVNDRKVKSVTNFYIDKLKIKTPSMEQIVKNLSGGNQQKVVLAKSLAANSNIILFDEPTRGIDVGAKHEIYELMHSLAGEGKAILMISSEMEELLGMSDRIIVISEGRFAGEVPKEKFDQKHILDLASGEE